MFRLGEEKRLYILREAAQRNIAALHAAPRPHGSIAVKASMCKTDGVQYRTVYILFPN